MNDFCIVGFDPARRPLIQSSPCIELVFQLSGEAPKEWCDEFNGFAPQRPYSVKIDPQEGVFIETWVRKPEEIEPALAKLKVLVQDCNVRYSAILDARNNRSVSEDDAPRETAEQQALNEVVDALVFDTLPES